MKPPLWRFAITTSALVGVALWANPASSFENEPTGYGGLQWGTMSTDGLKLLDEDPDNFDRIFAPVLDATSLGGVAVYDIEYRYNIMDVLYRVVLHTAGTPNFNTVSSYLSEIHGPAEEVLADGAQVWRGETTEIVLYIDPGTDFVTVTYTGVQEVERLLEMIDAASAVLDDAEEDSDEEQDDPFGILFR